MQQAAQTDAAMAARVRHLEFRTVEEFYDLRVDPNCLINVLGDVQGTETSADARRKQIEDLRAKLREWMVRVKDPALAAFDRRYQPKSLERFMQAYRARAATEVEALKPYEKRKGYRF